MKQIMIIFMIIVFGFSCVQNSKKSIDSNTDSITINKKEEKTVSDIDGSLDNVSYVADNGIIIDTIYHDSLTQKAIIYNTQIINDRFYIAYSKYSIEREVKYDMSFYYDGHYINSYDLKNLPTRKGELFDYNKLISRDSAILIGESCSHDDNLEFERFMKMPDSDSIIYIYAIKLDCSEWKTHMIIKKVNKHFVKLFEIESTDYRIDFELQNDSILICEYNQMFEDGIDTYNFKYDLIRNIEIK